MKKSVIAVVALLVAAALGASKAGVVTMSPVNADASYQIESGGPYGTYLDIEGTSNTYPSYGALDFPITAADLAAGTTIVSVTQLVFTPTQANFAYTAGGTLAFYLAASSADLSTGTFQAGAANNGIGDTFDPLYSLGERAFVPNATNYQPDPYTFDLSSLSPEAQKYLVDLLKNGGSLHLIVAPVDSTVVASWGSASTTYTSEIPNLTLTYTTAPIPEPGTLALFVIGGSFSLWRFRGRLSAA
jgi:hypothetical protein